MIYSGGNTCYLDTVLVILLYGQSSFFRNVIFTKDKNIKEEEKEVLLPDFILNSFPKQPKGQLSKAFDLFHIELMNLINQLNAHKEKRFTTNTLQQIFTMIHDVPLQSFMSSISFYTFLSFVYPKLLLSVEHFVSVLPYEDDMMLQQQIENEKELFVFENARLLKLKPIQSKMMIKEKEYHLYAFVAYFHQRHHYICYLKPSFITSCWYQYDGLKGLLEIPSNVSIDQMLERFHQDEIKSMNSSSWNDQGIGSNATASIELLFYMLR
jgi:hypothetical protein